MRVDSYQILKFKESFTNSKCLPSSPKYWLPGHVTERKEWTCIPFLVQTTHNSHYQYNGYHLYCVGIVHETFTEQ